MKRWLKYLLWGAAGLGAVGVARALTADDDRSEQDGHEDAALLLAKRPGGLSIAELRLATVALAGALALAADPQIGPRVVFSSGRRDWANQARIDVTQQGLKTAQAHNEESPDDPWSLLQGTISYITAVHTASPVREALLARLSTLPDWSPASDIQLAMVDVFRGFSDDELSRYSRHPAGFAFDYVLPDELQPRAAELLSALPGFDRILTNEGGIKVKHVQFKPTKSLAGLVVVEVA